MSLWSVCLTTPVLLNVIVNWRERERERERERVIEMGCRRREVMRTSSGSDVGVYYNVVYQTFLATRLH